MSDLVERLRSLADCDSRAGEPLGACMREGADALELLRAEFHQLLGVFEERCAELNEAEAENAKLREALEEIVRCSEVEVARNEYDDWGSGYDAGSSRAADIARAALAESQK